MLWWGGGGWEGQATARIMICRTILGNRKDDKKEFNIEEIGQSRGTLGSQTEGSMPKDML